MDNCKKMKKVVDKLVLKWYSLEAVSERVKKRTAEQKKIKKVVDKHWKMC